MPLDGVRGGPSRPKTCVDGRILPNLGRERHTLWSAGHNERNDAGPLDVELLRGGGTIGTNPSVEIQTISGDVRPIPRDQEQNNDLCDEQRAGHPLAREDVHCGPIEQFAYRWVATFAELRRGLRYNFAVFGRRLEMSQTRRAAGLALLAATVGVVGFSGRHAGAQAMASPTNDAPNPYQSIEGWAKLPEARTWGSTSAVDVDKDGKSIWVAERCGPHTPTGNSCLDRMTGKMSDLPSVLKFDPTGKLVKSFGAGMLIFPHGIHVDREGNVWVTDGQDNAPAPQRGAGGGRGRSDEPGTTAPPAGAQAAAGRQAGAGRQGRSGPL